MNMQIYFCFVISSVRKQEYGNLKTIKTLEPIFLFFLASVCNFLESIMRSWKCFWDFEKRCGKNVMLIVLTAFYYTNYCLVIFHHYLCSLQLYLLLWVCMSWVHHRILYICDTCLDVSDQLVACTFSNLVLWKLYHKMICKTPS